MGAMLFECWKPWVEHNNSIHRKKRKSNWLSITPLGNTIDRRLSAVLWGEILNYLSLEEAIACTNVNSFFRNQVSKEVSSLSILSNKCFDIPPVVLKRFSRVKQLLVYSLIKEAVPDENAKETDIIERYHLDQKTMEHLISFLTLILNHNQGLEYLYVGGFCENGSHKLKRRQFLLRESKRKRHRGDIELFIDNNIVYSNFDDNAKAAHAYRQFLQNFCKAYDDGIFPQSLITSSSIVPRQTSFYHHEFAFDCSWKSDKGVCDTCRRVCECLPVETVFHWSNLRSPCISLRERFQILYRRDREKFLNLISVSLKDTAGTCDRGRLVWHKKKVFFSGFQSEEMMDRLKLTIEYGGDVKDPLVRKSITRAPSCKGESGFGFEYNPMRRIISKDTFDNYRSVGMDISPEDFYIVDHKAEHPIDGVLS